MGGVKKARIWRGPPAEQHSYLKQSWRRSPLGWWVEALLTALLPLAFQATWHPARSLSDAPDLPENWWAMALEHLPLEEQPDRTACAPAPLRQALAGLLARRQPQVYRDLAVRHSLGLLRDGDLQGALTLLHDAGERSRADELLEQWIAARIMQGENQALQTQVEALPDAWVGARARAAYWLSCVSASDREKAAEARRAAHAAYDAGERNPRLLHLLSYALQIDGQYLPALQYAEEGLKRGASGTDALRLRQQRAMTLSYLGRTEDHLEAAQTLLAEARAQGDLYYSAVAHGTLAYAFEDSDDPETAAAHYQQAITLYRRISQWPLLATLLNNYAQSLSGAGRPAEALELLDEAARLPSTSPRHQGWIGLSRALVHHQYGLHAEALQSTARAVHLLHEAHLTGDVIVAQLLAAERLVMDGQLVGAREQLRAARGLLADQPRNTAHLQFSQGVLAFAEGDHAGAAALFADAQDGNLTEWDQARAALYRLAVDLEQGNPPDAAGLGGALTALGHDAPLLTDAPLLVRALGWLRQQSGWSGRLDAVFGGPAVVGRVPLRLELLGPLEVHHASGHLHFPLRRSAELLAYLVLHGPATRQQLLAALWEGTPDANMVDLFKKTLRGLRETLRPLVPAGMDPVMIENGKHRLHPVLDVSAAWLPDELFPAPAVRRGGPIEVRGAFLADAQGPWADDVRAGVQERLCAELERRAGEHDPSVLNALRVARGLN